MKFTKVTSSVLQILSFSPQWQSCNSWPILIIYHKVWCSFLKEMSWYLMKRCQFRNNFVVDTKLRFQIYFSYYEWIKLMLLCCPCWGCFVVLGSFHSFPIENMLDFFLMCLFYYIFNLIVALSKNDMCMWETSNS